MSHSKSCKTDSKAPTITLKTPKGGHKKKDVQDSNAEVVEEIISEGVVPWVCVSAHICITHTHTQNIHIKKINTQ